MSIPPTRLRLLIVEDCESDADLILLNLESAGYAVSSARVQSAKAMREAMEGEVWDAVISDYSMPGFSVHAALSIKNELNPDIPFIVVSGTVPEETAVDLMKAGAHDYLMKNKLTRLAPVLKREIQEAEVRRKRKLAEASLKEREARYRNLIGNIPDMIYTFSVRYGVLFFSPRVESMLGYSQEELIADPEIRRSLVHGEDRPAFDRSMADCQFGKHYDLQYRIHDRTGTERWLQDRSIKITPEGDDMVVDGIASDITERKRMEMEIRTSNFELAKLYDLSQSFSGAENVQDVYTIVTKSAVEDVHTTFSRLASMEGRDLVIKSAYPVRILDHELYVGCRYPADLLPFCMKVLAGDEAVVIDATDPSIGPEERSMLLLDHVTSACLVPLISTTPTGGGTRGTGLLMLGEARKKERESFTPQKLRMARSIAQLTSASIHRLSLRELNIRRLKKLSALREIDSAISSSFDLTFILATILGNIVRQLGVDAADVLLYDPQTESLRYASGLGFRETTRRDVRLGLGESQAGRAAAERCLVHVDETAEPGNLLLTGSLADEGFVAYYGIPLIAKGQILGVLEVYNRTRLEPDDEWLDFFGALANQAAIAIDNSTLFDRLESTNSELTAAYDATIQGWSRALDLRDKETEGHTLRVTEMTVRLAKAVGFSDEETLHAKRGALLHDIGKMGVPDAILLKPGPLTDEEWVLMKKHPMYAFELLSPINYLRPALDIPYCHHEKWDGSGYPQGLAGEDIPLSARIFAIVDVWDALRSDRPYRPAWREDRVIDHIRSLSGSHFDPAVVELFLGNLEREG